VDWYEERRRRWKPDAVRVLLVGESAPDPGATERRFFYAPTLDRRDNLFRGVVAALYDAIPPGSTGKPKQPWLERLRAHGVYLIDLVPFPVDNLSPGERRRARGEHVAALVARAKALKPEIVIICHGPTFADTAPALRAAGLTLAHADPLPFPLGNHRAAFVAGVRAALASTAPPELDSRAPSALSAKPPTPQTVGGLSNEGQRVESYLQQELRRRRIEEVSAVEAARWLDEAHILRDSPSRPGLPLRNLLRAGAMESADQRPAQANGRWFIVRR
jgi:hypothetical protein